MSLSSLKHLLITQLDVVNKILKDLIHKIALGKEHRFFHSLSLSKDGIFGACIDFMSRFHVQFLYIFS